MNKSGHAVAGHAKVGIVTASFLTREWMVSPIVAKLIHYVNSIQTRSFFWSIFSRIRTEYGYLSVFGPNEGKCGPEKAPYLDTFHAVIEDFVNEWHLNTMQWKYMDFI